MPVVRAERVSPCCRPNPQRIWRSGIDEIVGMRFGEGKEVRWAGTRVARIQFALATFARSEKRRGMKECLERWVISPLPPDFAEFGESFA